MFNFFKPKLPIALQDKAWIEYRWRWLGENIGWDLMRKSPTLTLDDFPDIQDSSEESGRRLFMQIAQQYEISPNDVNLEFRDQLTLDEHGEAGHSSLGLYHPGNALQRAKISIGTSLLRRPAELVATMAHELAHHLLLGRPEKLNAADEIDHEDLTDLTVVFAGFGLFAANCTVYDRSSSDGTMSYFQISKSGYLSSMQFGYALGLLAWMKGELSPAWIGQLRDDAKVPCSKAIGYLKKTGDALVQPNCFFTKAERSKNRGVKKLASLSPTVRLATLFEWQFESPPIDEVLGQVAPLLDDSILAIRIAAIQLFVDRRMPLNQDSEHALLRNFGSEDESESLLACQALLQRGFSRTEDLLEQSRYWFSKDSESYLARSTYVTILQRLPVNRFLPDCQKAIVAKVDRELRVGGEAEELLDALRRIPDLEAIINSFYDHWSEERQQGLVYFRDTGRRPVQL